MGDSYNEQNAKKYKDEPKIKRGEANSKKRHKTKQLLDNLKNQSYFNRGDGYHIDEEYDDIYED